MSRFFNIRIQTWKLWSAGILVGLVSLLVGCNASSERPIRVGVTAGPHTEIMEYVQRLAAAEGLKLEVIEFSDFIMPNSALAEGSLDANCYQHERFLQECIHTRGYPLVAIAQTILEPIRMYSAKFTDVQQLPVGAQIGIPNDPTNEARALELLEVLGLITLKTGVKGLPTILDINQNPQKFRILPVEAPQLTRSLVDLDAAVINTTFAVLGGLDVTTALAVESIDAQYANVLVVRAHDAQKPELLHLARIYQSDKTKAYIKNRYGEAILPCW